MFKYFTARRNLPMTDFWQAMFKSPLVDSAQNRWLGTMHGDAHLRFSTFFGCSNHSLNLAE
jgi:hypothetical protein